MERAVVERRNPQASCLRDLFGVQWDYLARLIEDYNKRKLASRASREEERQAIETLVEGTNPRLRLLPRFHERLRKSTRMILDYVSGMVQQLPPVIAVSRDRYQHDPQVCAFFVNTDHVREVFSQSNDIQDYFSDPSNDEESHVFAAMFMNKMEKEVLGTGTMGTHMTRDVRKSMVSFNSHKLRRASNSEQQARVALECYLFESIVDYINYRLASLGVTPAGDNGPMTDAPKKRTTGPNMRIPSTYLRELCGTVMQPEKLLRLESSLIRLNRIGERVAEDSSQLASDILLQEISVGQHFHNVVALVSYPRDELISRAELLRRACNSLRI